MHTFSTSLLVFWVKGKISIDSRFLKVKVPNTVMGVIPLGSKEDIIPLKTISNIQIDTTYKLAPLIIGGFLAASSVANIFNTGLGGLIFLAIYVAIAGSGIRTTLTFDKSGSKQVVSAPFFEAKQLHAIKDEIYEKMMIHEDSRDLNMYFDKK